MKFLKYTLLLGFLALLSCNSILEEKTELITLKTNLGTMRFLLFDETPKHKANFIKLTNEGFYKGTLFHRVVDDFMIQGGNPTSKNSPKGSRIGAGGTSYKIPAEIVPKLLHRKGALAAIRDNDSVNPQKESNGSQFYIIEGKKWSELELKMMRVDFKKIRGYFLNFMRREGNETLKQKFTDLEAQNDKRAVMELLTSYRDTLEQAYNSELGGEEISQAHKEIYMKEGGFPSLDGSYTVFGMLVDGFDVLEKISVSPTDTYKRPLDDVILEEVSLEHLPKSKITELYGYKFENSKQ
jgi:cyclophilin family peptidyl-prolyl cis-trans isomerase